MRQKPEFKAARDAIIRVDGARGFIVGNPGDQFVITAAHCLPCLPRASPALYQSEKTFDNLLGPLGEDELDVCTECFFADPISDLAILGRPDVQASGGKADAFEKLVDRPPLRIGDAPEEVEAWLLGLDGQWGKCRVTCFGGPLWIDDATEGIQGGMSGSPILMDDCTAIGVVSVSGGEENILHTGGGPNPSLMGNLPGWLLRQLD